MGEMIASGTAITNSLLLHTRIFQLASRNQQKWYNLIAGSWVQ
jgi:hypothetical protein